MVSGLVQPGSSRMRFYASCLIALLAVAASLTGIQNGFALDDVEIIARNDRVHSLSSIWLIFAEPYWPPEMGSSLYRPFTVLAFALQWTIGGGSPLPFHVTSILVYALCSVAVLRLCEEIVDWPVAWLAAALFAVHPVHVEAVANVVGQAELWAALLSIVAATLFIRVRRRGDMRRFDITVIAALYGGALMFKEHVIVLPALLVAAELTIVGQGRAVSRLRGIAPLLGAMAVVGLGFLVIRTAVLGEFEGGGTSPIFLEQDFVSRFLTMLRVVLEWIRLFFWPAELAADYSASRIRLASRFEPDMLPGAAVLAGAILIAVHFRRTNPALTLGIAWAGIALLIPSNLIVVTGFVLAERALFLPSVGVMLVAASALSAVVRMAPEAGTASRTLVAVVVVLILALGVARSSTRNTIWKNNETLITQTVEDAPSSARAHMMLAQLHLDRGDVKHAIEETSLALLVGQETDSQLLAFSADVFQMGGKCEAASQLYARSLALNRDQPQVRINYASCKSRPARTDTTSPTDHWLVHVAQYPDSMLVLPTMGILARAAREARN